jgi:teichuronic acid biosynthesis glycosyltransferase TuaG
MPKKIISIIVTTYNSSDVIIRTLDSIIAQLGDKDELLIFDDFSNDDTVVKVKNFLADKVIDYKIKVATINNGGPAFGRNWGIKSAEGKYICFCDADDEWLAGKLTIQLDFLETNNFDFCGTRCFVIGSKQYPTFYGEVSILSQLARNKFSLSTLMFKAECFKASNILLDERRDYHAVEDYELILRLLARGSKGYVINLLLVNYFHNANSLSHINTKKSELKRILVLKNFNATNICQLSFVKLIIFILEIRIVYHGLRDYFSKL